MCEWPPRVPAMPSCPPMSHLVGQLLLGSLLSSLLLGGRAQHGAVLQGEPLHLTVQLHALGEPLARKQCWGHGGKAQGSVLPTLPPRKANSD